MAEKKYLDFTGLTELVNKLKAFFQKKEFTGTHDEWNQLTPTEKANYEIVNFTDDLGCSYKDVYSTNEVKTNIIWVDENGVEHPAYRKVLNHVMQGVSSETSNQEIIPSTIQNIAEMIKFEAFMIPNAWMMPNGVIANDHDFIRCWYRKPNHATYPNSFAAMYDDSEIGSVLRIISLYTKTTD